jgi:hypothetical protein
MLAAILFVAMAATASAQTPTGGIVIVDDGNVVDQEQLRKEHDVLIRLLTEDPQAAARSGLLKKTEYCLTCRNGGARTNCIAPFGGETGKMWCASQCLYKCQSACRVAVKAC